MYSVRERHPVLSENALYAILVFFDQKVLRGNTGKQTTVKPAHLLNASIQARDKKIVSDLKLQDVTLKWRF